MCLLSILSNVGFTIFAPAQSYAFYQINSEALNIPNIGGTQADMKLLVGKEFLNSSRIAIGLHSLYQSARDPSYYIRYGPMLQIRSKLFFDNFFIHYEHHEFVVKTSYTEATNTSSSRFNSENRYGFIYSRYDGLSENIIVDSYLETFLIPQVSDTNWLSVVRSTLLYKAFAVNPLIEVYLRDSPQNFGGALYLSASYCIASRTARPTARAKCRFF